MVETGRGFVKRCVLGCVVLALAGISFAEQAPSAASLAAGWGDIKASHRASHPEPQSSVHLKPTPQALFASTSWVVDPNVNTISIQPDEGISIAFDAKRERTCGR